MKAVTASSGNIFADLGLPNPEDALARAQLASHIRQVIKKRRLTQAAAAKVMGIDQPKVSALFNGRLSGFSTDRLMHLLTTLGHDINITPCKARSPGQHGRVRVMEMVS
jgi:predicted XRE-type DNA-binding protein